MAEQASEMAGWPLPKHGTFCWTEIASNDADKCQAFYNEVFGWKFQGGADAAAPGMDYREFSTGGDDPVGGLYQLDPKWFGDNPPPPHSDEARFVAPTSMRDVEPSVHLWVERRALGGRR